MKTGFKGSENISIFKGSENISIRGLKIFGKPVRGLKIFGLFPENPLTGYPDLKMTRPLTVSQIYSISL